MSKPLLSRGRRKQTTKLETWKRIGSTIILGLTTLFQL